MKLYESAYTYFPFIYLYFVSVVFGALYHNVALTLYQPYIVLVCTLINTGVFYIHDTDTIIKHAVHRHIWKTVTLSIYGIMVNNIHLEMLRDFHFTSDNVNLIVSFVYATSILTMSYYFEYIGGGILIHLVFLFIPMQRVWQVNLYMYVVYTTLAIILMYRRIKVSSLNDLSIHVNPVVKFFMYLRLHDLFIVVGTLQIYIEYYKSTLPEKRALENISKTIEGMRQLRRNGYEVQSLYEETRQNNHSTEDV